MFMIKTFKSWINFSIDLLKTESNSSDTRLHSWQCFPNRTSAQILPNLCSTTLLVSRVVRIGFNTNRIDRWMASRPTITRITSVMVITLLAMLIPKWDKTFGRRTTRTAATCGQEFKVNRIIIIRTMDRNIREMGSNKIKGSRISSPRAQTSTQTNSIEVISPLIVTLVVDGSQLKTNTISTSANTLWFVIEILLWINLWNLIYRSVD